MAVPWARERFSVSPNQSNYTSEPCTLKRFNSMVYSHLPNTTTTSTVDTLNLPLEYADLIEVFSKRKASQLPSHRSVDCSINLLPGTTPPKGRIFPLSQPESESMKTYIQEELAKGFIRPSTSPASAGFFFVKKKDGA